MKNRDKNQPLILFFISSLIFLMPLPVVAKVFKSKFIRLELPKNWSCQQEELDHSCQPDNINERNEAIIIIVTKPVDPIDDTFKKYEEILNKPKKMRDLVGKSYMSKVKYTNRKTIRNHEWVDSLHVGSEIPGFFSRYVASTKDKVAGLITYHIAESVYAKWAQKLNQMIESAEIFFDPAAFKKMTQSQDPLFSRNKASQYWDAGLPDDENTEKPNEGDESSGLLLGGLLAVIFLAYGFIKFKNRQS